MISQFAFEHQFHEGWVSASSILQVTTNSSLFHDSVDDGTFHTCSIPEAMHYHNDKALLKVFKTSPLPVACFNHP